MYTFILMYFNTVIHGGEQNALYIYDISVIKMAFLEFIKWSRKHT